MKNAKTFTVRADEETIQKLRHLSTYYGRTASGQIRVLLRESIERFEKTHGTIELSNDE